MALPKVFISSTCYDLGQIRDSLSEFINGYCYECLLSERGDVFYHPDLHTHESCLNEIENCQLFILVIGGRFGGEYKFDPKKSITNAEYEAAKFLKIPVFTFVKKDLLDDHRLYQKNRHNKELVEQITYPSIEGQEKAVNIFEFINQVRSADVNNGFFPFEFAKDIKHYLGKQWAGMMFDFLNSRIKDYNQKVVNSTLDNLSLMYKKTEDLLENLVRNVDPTSGNKRIEDLDKIVIASKFYKQVLRMFQMETFSSSFEILSAIEPSDLKWYQYLSKFGDFKLSKPRKKEDLGYTDPYKSTLFIQDIKGRISWTVESEIDEYHSEVLLARSLYDNVRILDKNERLKALEFTFTN